MTPHPTCCACTSGSAQLLEYIVTRDRSQAAARAVLPGLRAVAAAVVGADSELTATGMLVLAFKPIDPNWLP